MTQSNPTIDILLASYNGEKFIEAQIDSILNQTYQNIHLYIKDDCSTDSTLQLIQKKINLHPQKITLISAENNSGAIATFSSLMQQAKSSYIMFADQDDFWLPEKITMTLNKMKELEKHCGTNFPLLIHTDLKVVDSTLQPIHSSFWKYSKINPSKTTSLNRLLVQNVITGCTVMINQSLLKIASPIPNNAIMHDWWIGLTAAAFGKIGIVKEPTMLYRQHNLNQVGAKKVGVISEIKKYVISPFKYREAIKQLIILQKKQTILFLDLFNSSLKTSQIEIIRSYSTFHDKSIIKKLYLMLRFGLYKNGFLRNLKEIILYNSTQIGA